jgi:hypothetical protein
MSLIDKTVFGVPKETIERYTVTVERIIPGPF